MTLKQEVLDKLAKENGQDNWNCLKQSLILTKDHFTITYVKCAVELALAAKQAEVLKIVREVEEGFEGTAVEFCEKHGDASYTGFKECLKEILRRLLAKTEKVEEKE